jgi:hypothetical protein
MRVDLAGFAKQNDEDGLGDVVGGRGIGGLSAGGAKDEGAVAFDELPEGLLVAPFNERRKALVIG